MQGNENSEQTKMKKLILLLLCAVPLCGTIAGTRCYQ
jgi:hypothetical protein